MTTLDWYGCATFRLRTGGLTVFLDAYIDRVAGAAGPGLTADAIDACDWIVVGHSHFDHLWGAERIMRNTRARLIGSYETIRVMETVDLGSGVRVSVYPSQHLCVWSQGQMAQADQVCIGDLGVTLQEQRRRFGELVAHLTNLGRTTLDHLLASNQEARGDGGALLYLFETPEGSILYQDTSGHWTGVVRDLRPDVAILAAAGRGNIDGEPIQGSLAQFVARQVDLVRPHRVILSHHDDWLPGFSVATDVAPIRREIERVAPRAALVEVGYVAATPILPA